MAAYDNLGRAGDAVSMVVASGLLPGAMEIMDRLAIKAAEASVGAGYPLDAEALLIVELEGEASQVEAEFAQLRASDRRIRALSKFTRPTAKMNAPASGKGRKGDFFRRGTPQPRLHRSGWRRAAQSLGRSPGQDRRTQGEVSA